jgi:hypothetical protein
MAAAAAVGVAVVAAAGIREGAAVEVAAAVVAIRLAAGSAKT